MEKISAILLEYLSSFDEDFTRNKFYEAFTVKFVFYNYFYLSFILLLSTSKQKENEQNLLFIDNFLDTFNKNFKIKDVVFISDIQKEIKNSLYYSQEEIINHIKLISNEYIIFVYFVRLFFFEKKALFSFLKKQKISIEFFAKSMTLIFLNDLNFNLNELVLFENNSKSNMEEISNFLFEFSYSSNFSINLLKIAKY